MLLSYVLAGLVAIAQASPVADLFERAPEAKIVTKTKYVDVWVTITAGAAAAKPTSNKVWWYRPQNPPSVPSNPPPQDPTPVVPSVPVVNTPQPVVSTPVVVATSSEAPATIPSPPASNNGGLTPFAQKVIDHHNVHRQNHSAPDIAWDQSLANTAAKIGRTCVYAHSMDVDGGGYGQNIAAGAPESDITGVLTELNYNQEEPKFEPYYGQATPDNFDAEFHGYGHFTQMVWMNTKSVGCAVIDCSSSGLSGTSANVAPFFTVCNYKPPGNYGGQFAENVKRGLGKPPITKNWPN